MSGPRLRRGLVALLAALSLGVAASGSTNNTTAVKPAPDPAGTQNQAAELDEADEPSAPQPENAGESVPAGGEPVPPPKADSSPALADGDSLPSLLGQSLVTDLLFLAAASLIGAIAAVLVVWSTSGDRRRRELAPINERLDRLEAKWAAGAVSRVQTQADPPPRTGLRSRDDGDFDAGFRLDSGDAAAFGGPASAAPRQPNRGEVDSARAERMMKALDDYKGLVATRGSKPRHFAELLTAFVDVRSLEFDSGQRLSAGAYRENEANQFVLAVGDGQRFAVLPTYDYIADFPIAFAAPVQNPEIVKQLFDLEADNSGQLRVDRHAEIELAESGEVHIVSRGRLSGFKK